MTYVAKPMHGGWRLVQAVFEAVDNKNPEKLRWCDVQKLINTLKFNKTIGFDGIPN
jgi:hypothetical protein